MCWIKDPHSLSSPLLPPTQFSPVFCKAPSSIQSLLFSAVFIQIELSSKAASSLSKDAHILVNGINIIPQNKCPAFFFYFLQEETNILWKALMFMVPHFTICSHLLVSYCIFYFFPSIPKSACPHLEGPIHPYFFIVVMETDYRDYRDPKQHFGQSRCVLQQLSSKMSSTI